MGNEITMPNPYRPGSHLYHIFDILKNGDMLFVQRIEYLLGHYMNDSSWRVWRKIPVPRRVRRVASALRTIRAHPRLNVIYDRYSETYRMVQLF